MEFSSECVLALASSRLEAASFFFRTPLALFADPLAHLRFRLRLLLDNSIGTVAGAQPLGVNFVCTVPGPRSRF